jgi:hypothetical protein
MCVSRLVSFAVIGALGMLLWGCSKGPSYVAQPEPWRAQEERACLVSGQVREKPWLVTRASLGGPSSYCGAMQPFEMAAAADGRVQMRPAALLRCNMIPSVERWVRQVIEPEARRHYGVPLAELRVAASYSCRPRNGQWGAKLSEHGHANALDISAFTLADGRTITVRQGWWGDQRDRSFLRAVHAGACREFTTILGPMADRFHHDHFHVDLARHGRSGQEVVCR